MSLPKYVTDAIAAAVEDVVRSATLDSALEMAVIRQLGGPNRVLPEGKANLCSAVTLLSSRSESPGEALADVPAAAAMEMLMATGDLIDQIQDDEADLSDDRRSVGCLLQAVTLLVMLCHTSIGRLADSGVSARRVVRAYKVVDELGVRALRGQSLDIDMESRSLVPVEHSLDVSCLKSASLVMCAVTDDIEEIDLYGRFGWHFGLIAQLPNDVAAVWPGTRRSQTSVFARRHCPSPLPSTSPRRRAVTRESSGLTTTRRKAGSRRSMRRRSGEPCGAAEPYTTRGWRPPERRRRPRKPQGV